MYVVDAGAIARANNLGVRINMVMEAVFFKLSGIIPYDKAIAALKEQVSAAYLHEGGRVVADNNAAIDAAAGAVVEVAVDPAWASAADGACGIDAVGSDLPGICAEGGAAMSAS